MGNTAKHLAIFFSSNNVFFFLQTFCIFFSPFSPKIVYPSLKIQNGRFLPRPLPRSRPSSRCRRSTDTTSSLKASRHYLDAVSKVEVGRGAEERTDSSWDHAPGTVGTFKSACAVGPRLNFRPRPLIGERDTLLGSHGGTYTGIAVLTATGRYIVWTFCPRAPSSYGSFLLVNGDVEVNSIFFGCFCFFFKRMGDMWFQKNGDSQSACHRRQRRWQDMPHMPLH